MYAQLLNPTEIDTNDKLQYSDGESEDKKIILELGSNSCSTSTSPSTSSTSLYNPVVYHQQLISTAPHCSRKRSAIDWTQSDDPPLFKKRILELGSNLCSTSTSTSTSSTSKSSTSLYNPTVYHQQPISTALYFSRDRPTINWTQSEISPPEIDKNNKLQCSDDESEDKKIIVELGSNSCSTSTSPSTSNTSLYNPAVYHQQPISTALHCSRKRPAIAWAQSEICPPPFKKIILELGSNSCSTSTSPSTSSTSLYNPAVYHQQPISTALHCSRKRPAIAWTQSDDPPSFKKIILELGSNSCTASTSTSSASLYNPTVYHQQPISTALYFSRDRQTIDWTQSEISPPPFRTVYSNLKEHRIVRVPNLSTKEREIQLDEGDLPESTDLLPGENHKKTPSDRERIRQREHNVAYNRLRSVIPFSKPSGKKCSKIETLRYAISYIKFLEIELESPTLLPEAEYSTYGQHPYPSTYYESSGLNNNWQIQPTPHVPYHYMQS